MPQGRRDWYKSQHQMVPQCCCQIQKLPDSQLIRDSTEVSDLFSESDLLSEFDILLLEYNNRRGKRLRTETVIEKSDFRTNIPKDDFCTTCTGREFLYKSYRKSIFVQNIQKENFCTNCIERGFHTKCTKRGVS